MHWAFFSFIFTATLASKVEDLRAEALASPHYVLKLNDASYQTLTTGERDYGTVILLTALDPQFNCAPCAEHDPEFRALAQSWWKKNRKRSVTDGTPLFFASLDFKDGQSTYAALGLSVAPTMAYWPPSANKSSSKKYEFDRKGFKAEPLAQWLSVEHGTEVPFSRPIDPMLLASPIITLVLGVAMLYWAWDHVVAVVSNRYLWAVATLGFILTMIGGYMWAQMRTPQWMHVGGNGETGYFQGGYGNQYGVEVPLMALVYFCLGFAVVMLTMVVPRVQDTTKQRLSVYLWSFTFLGLFNMLVNIFKVKQGGYPFKIFF